MKQYLISLAYFKYADLSGPRRYHTEVIESSSIKDAFEKLKNIGYGIQIINVYSEDVRYPTSKGYN